MTTPWLSVITVVKDAPADFAATLASLRLQECPGFELVVIDSSSDSAAIPALLAEVSGLDCRYLWVAPAGIYPAMNEGLRQAVGDYAYFLNAGDTLLAPDSLAAVRALVDATQPEWLFTDVEMVDDRGDALVTPDWDYDEEQRACFSRGHFPCHQGTFARRSSLLALGGFDTSYRIVADYAMFLRLSRQSRPGRLRLPVAAFQPGGISTLRWREAAAEFHRARREILHPGGRQAVAEQWETWRLLAATAAYRSLWAPGKPAHGLMARLRGR